jgi:nucleoside-diphosphate-sugar epimerase
MKILITGKNSYIGKSFYNWVKEHEPSFEVDQLSLRNINLSDLSFKGYDVIFHVAGIAHITSNKKLVPEYFRINRHLAIEVAIKAKQEGIKQFIFTSSIAIYGDDLPIGVIKPIDVNLPKPTNAYGQSKLEADLEIQKLDDESFKTIILRIPMVYGENANGNFPKLYNFSKCFFVFPQINNQRSVLHVDNLSRVISYLIKNNLNGVYYPQDKQYLETVKLIKKIRSVKFNIVLKLFNFPLKVLSRKLVFINKIFGNKFFEQSLSKIKDCNYQVNNIYDFIEQINY